MSTPSHSPGAERLVAYLRHGGHALELDRASAIVDALPQGDTKAAARELRARLLEAGIAVKHTHALKAVSDVLGNGHSSLANAHWEVATWVLDAPAVSARRRRVRSIGEAADLLIARLGEQADPGDAPLVRLLQRDFVEIAIVGQPCPGWRAVLVQVDSAGNVLPIDETTRARLAERVRRFVEGAPVGWVSGALHPSADGAAYRLTVQGDVITFSDEESFVRRLCTESGAETAGLNPREAAVEAGLLQPMVKVGAKDWSALDLECLVRLFKRLQSFRDRSAGDFAEMLEGAYGEASLSFMPEPLNYALVHAEMKRLSLSNVAVARELGLSITAWDTHLQGGNLPVALFPRLAAVLGRPSADDLLGRPLRGLARIPVRDVAGMGLFMGKFEHLSIEASVRFHASTATRRLLEYLVAMAPEVRSRWEKRPAPELQEVLDLVRAHGTTLCVHMERRFVKDLPAGLERMAIAMVLSTPPTAEVDQYAPETEATRMPIEDPVDEVWLERFNAPDFTGSDMLRYANMVAEMRVPEDNARGHFETQTHAGVRVFARDPHRAHSAQVRMEALADLMAKVNLEPWIQPSSEEGASMLSKPVFEAVARCRLIDVDGRPGFDAAEFQHHIVAHVATT